MLWGLLDLVWSLLNLWGSPFYICISFFSAICYYFWDAELRSHIPASCRNHGHEWRRQVVLWLVDAPTTKGFQPLQLSRETSNVHVKPESGRVFRLSFQVTGKSPVIISSSSGFNTPMNLGQQPEF